jgi:ribosome maturation factor RimP
MDKQKVTDLVNEVLEENTLLFLVELSILPNNKILIEVDGDAGVSLSEIMKISRNVESNLDREEEDFSLEVTSPDISEPLKVKRQYIKNIGRILQIKTVTEDFEGTLVKTSQEYVVIEWKAREPKPIGKGKVTVAKTATVAYKDIKQAKVKIVF